MITKWAVNDQDQLSTKGCELLSWPNFEDAELENFEGDAIAIFIHGFTANADHMKILMARFAKFGFSTLAFNYPCYKGIDVAANRLGFILKKLDVLSGGAIKEKRVILVCHSMGGLVARALIGLEQGQTYVKKIITLGTPHDATLTNSLVLEHLVSLGESVSTLVKGGFSKSGRSALQLIGGDEPDYLLKKLKTLTPGKPSVSYFSVSGGNQYLTVGKNRILNIIVNKCIQGKLNVRPNDGLVTESSSDLSQEIFRQCAPSCIHFNQYPEYEEINHSNLIQNYSLFLQLIEFAKSP